MNNQWFVIYCIIYNAECRSDIIAQTQRDYFSDLALYIYDYAVEVNSRNGKLDWTLLKSKLSEEQFKELSETFKAKSLQQTDIQNYLEYINNLKESYAQSLIKNLGSLLNSNDLSVEQFTSEVEITLKKISGSNDDEITSISDISEKFFNRINDEESAPPKAFIFGVSDIDKQVEEISHEDFVIVAGRPGMGKSAFGGYIALSNALNNVPVLFFSLEMSNELIGKRLYGAACDVELWKFKKKKFRNKEEAERVQHYYEQFKKMPLIIDNTTSLTINKMRSVIERVKIKYGDLGLIIVDYLQLMHGVAENQQLMVANISKNLKMIAKQNKTPVVALSQLSRKVEERENKRPILSDLRDSGGIEQDADIVAMLYRDSYYTKEQSTIRLCEVLLQKYRDGDSNTKIIVDYNPKTQAFKSLNPASELFRLAQKFMYQ